MTQTGVPGSSLGMTARQLNADIQVPALAPGLQERHRIYALCAMALVYKEWNGNKFGIHGTYYDRDSQRVNGNFVGDYLGHNIAAIAVDPMGKALGFDFNHNVIFSSTVEHAESRLVRWLYGQANAHTMWNKVVGQDLGSARSELGTNNLRNVRLYTTLEPCSQCAGIMALTKISQLIFLQNDDLMHHISDYLYNLSTRSGYQSPLPLRGTDFGFHYFDELNQAYLDFLDNQNAPGGWFYENANGSRRKDPTITSFLCTDTARAIYQKAHAAFTQLATSEPAGLSYPDFSEPEVSNSLSNLAVLESAKSLYYYAITRGHRGTPHQM